MGTLLGRRDLVRRVKQGVLPAPCGPMRAWFFFKQKTAYEIRPRDWSSDVCSSDLTDPHEGAREVMRRRQQPVAVIDKIGRASCRERVSISVVAVSLKKKQQTAQ